MAVDSKPGHRATQRPGGIAAQAIVLATFWIVFSGKLDALHLAFGALSIGIVLALSRGLVARGAPGRGARAQASPPRIHPGAALRYLGWLAREIIVANIDIARLVLDPRLPIDPVIIRFRTRLPGRVAKVALANSITLTPGTVTLEIRGSELLVHAITEASATGPVIDEMERRLLAVVGAPPPPAPVAITVLRALPRRGRAT